MSRETETGIEDGRKTIMRMMECIAEGNEEKADALLTEYMTETARRMFTDGIQKMLSPADAERGAVDAGPLQLDPDNYDDGGEKAGFVPAPPDPTDKYVSDVPYARPAMTGVDAEDEALAASAFGAEDISTLDELDGIGGHADDDVAAFLGPRGGVPTMAYEAADPSKGKGKSPDRSSKSDDLVREISADAEEIDAENRNGDVRESAGSERRRPANLKEGTHQDILGTTTSYYGYGVRIKKDGTCEILNGEGNHVAFADDDDEAFDRCVGYASVPDNFNGRGKPKHRKQVKEKWRGTPIVKVTYPDGSEETYGIGKEGSKPIELTGEKMFDSLDEARAHVDAAKRAAGVNESAGGKAPESYLFRRPAPGVLNEADGDNRDDEEFEKAEKDLNNEMKSGQGEAARDAGPSQEDIGVGPEGGEDGQPQLDQDGGQLDDGSQGGADGDPSNGEEEVTTQDVEERVETVAAVAEKVLDDAGALEDAIVEMRKAYEKNEESRDAEAAAAAQEPDPQDPENPQGGPEQEGGDGGQEPENPENPDDGVAHEYGVGNQGGQQAQQDQDAGSDNENFFHLPNEDGQGNGQNQGGRK